MPILVSLFEFLTETPVGQFLLGFVLFTLLVWWVGFILRFGWITAGRFAEQSHADAMKAARAAKQALPSLEERLRHLEDAGPRYREAAKSQPRGARDDYLMKWKKHAAEVSAQIRENAQIVAKYERRYGALP